VNQFGDNHEKVPARGLPVDAGGGPTIDPTQNVKDLTIAEARRQDDLRAASKELTEAKIAHLKEIAEERAKHQDEIGRLREGYQEKIQHAESGRLDSIRQVDREEVAKTAVAANTAITVLAKQTTDLASTLDKKVSDTATAAEARNSAAYTDVNKRLSALELSSSEGKGKQTVVDPQMDKLTLLVETLARNQATGTGKSEGIGQFWGVIVAAAGLLFGGYAFISSATKAPVAAPQIVYVPAPAPETARPPVAGQPAAQ
jgi:hypothetical protein